MIKATTLYLLGAVAVSAAVTILLRALPFLLFGSGRKPPKIVETIGGAMAPAAIAMLVAYCFCGYFGDGLHAANVYGLREFAAGAIVVALQLWRRNPLLSIAAGTAAYMAMLRLIPA